MKHLPPPPPLLPPDEEVEGVALAPPEELELPEVLPPVPLLDEAAGSVSATRNTPPSLVPITKSLRLLLYQSTAKGAALALTTIGPPWPVSAAPLVKAGAASVPVLRKR
jgi:hypothetical protein